LAGCVDLAFEGILSSLGTLRIALKDFEMAFSKPRIQISIQPSMRSLSSVFM